MSWSASSARANEAGNAVDGATLVVPAHDRRGRAILTLVATDAAHPRIEVDEHAADDGELAISAAAVWRRAVERTIVKPLVLLHGCVGLFEGHLDLVSLRDLVAKRERLRGNKSLPSLISSFP